MWWNLGRGTLEIEELREFEKFKVRKFKELEVRNFENFEELEL